MHPVLRKTFDNVCITQSVFTLFHAKIFEDLPFQESRGILRMFKFQRLRYIMDGFIRSRKFRIGQGISIRQFLYVDIPSFDVFYMCIYISSGYISPVLY